MQTRLWHLRAQFSTAKPPPLTRHTLTCVNDTIYLFGGSTSDGEFSSQLWRVKLRSDDTEQWEEVSPRGGNYFCSKFSILEAKIIIGFLICSSIIKALLDVVSINIDFLLFNSS